MESAAVLMPPFLRALDLLKLPHFLPTHIIEFCNHFCKFGNFHEGIIFAKLHTAKFQENKTFVKW